MGTDCDSGTALFQLDTILRWMPLTATNFGNGCADVWWAALSVQLVLQLEMDMEWSHGSEDIAKLPEIAAAIQGLNT